MAFYWILQSYLLRCMLFVVITHAEEVFNTTPPTVKTSFSCYNRPMGFYADIEANCKIYHTCDDHGNKFTYRCPEGTAFRQDASICDHVYLVDCQATIYSSAQHPNENIDKEIAHVTSSTRSPVESSNSLDDHRLAFSRSFHVIQRPDKSMPNKFQTGFVFSANLFLKDQTRNQARQITDNCTTCKADLRNHMTVSTARTLTKEFDSWNLRNCHQRLMTKALSNSSPAKAMASEDNRHSSFLREKSFSSYNRDIHPYSETLRSIQANAYVKSTTEIPVHALTLSLEPLVPNELEYDPYYPRQPTSTEAYYTPSNRNKINTNTRFSSSSQAPIIVVHPNLPFEIPSVLPDLNTLEDLVDRRKFFYIPRTNVKSI
ncbi:hypothetical protein ALC60_02945 [Trachymyrmex zeteki]|uniref:Chitin-binding type-2 domain-containing protein n=1 Tax=Mycetomoellerius zeteki TaxID=64791 RepID=A0A151XBX9_9HYME|nr:hypothetical protein ALC60_02945 [Trachymyrmex zeteki]